MSTGLSLISVGLRDERDPSLRALDEARSCDSLYMETYTTKLGTDVERVSDVIGKPVMELSRSNLEEGSRELLEEAKRRRVGILVGGDALTATTHISLIVDAKRKGIPTRVVHGSSIFTAIAETGLSLYRFGKTATLPMPEKGPPDTVLKAIEDNLEHGLHTLILLDLDAGNDRYLIIKDALTTLLDGGRPNIFGDEILTVGVARLGSTDSIIKADSAANVAKMEFGPPPHALVVPGSLHFLEEEALKIIAGCPETIIKERRILGETERLIDKYVRSCRGALYGLELGALPKQLSIEDVKGMIVHAERYLSDSEYYAADRRATALASVSYCEGILDALRLLGLVDFEW